MSVTESLSPADGPYFNYYKLFYSQNSTKYGVKNKFNVFVMMNTT